MAPFVCLYDADALGEQHSCGQTGAQSPDVIGVHLGLKPGGGSVCIGGFADDGQVSLVFEVGEKLPLIPAEAKQHGCVWQWSGFQKVASKAKECVGSQTRQPRIWIAACFGGLQQIFTGEGGFSSGS